MEYAKAKLFGPLGINEVFWVHDPQGISKAGYGLYLQRRDMAKIGYLYLRNGGWEGKQLLPPQWIGKIAHSDTEHSNLFWVLPGKHVYMAVGAYRQVIMVFPDLDVVTVTTARVDNYAFSEWDDAILRSVKSDKALPADAPSAKLLASKIADALTEKPTEVGPTSKLAGAISGKVYRFAPNPIDVKSVSLMLTDPQPRYDIEVYPNHPAEPAPRFAGPIGLDGWYREGEPTYIQSLGIRGINAVKGSWLDDHTFVMNGLILGQGPTQTWTLTFDGDKLNVRVKFGALPDISIDGKTGQ
jgi:hypothetical protein